MKALTVQQPWAWAIVHGGKDVENRTQAWSYRGPLAIHAGARWSDRGEATVQRLTGKVVTQSAMGAIVGVVDLVDVHHYAGSGPQAIDCCDSPWAEESYDEHGGKRRLDIVHLVLENPRPLVRPLPCKGRLGLWSLPPEVLLAVIEGQAISA